MAASNPAQYAKLGKEEGEQSDAKNIRPGELNQPVRVPELELKRSVTCWQVLPPDFQPPLDEAWTTGIFGCAEDPESCMCHLIHSFS